MSIKKTDFGKTKDGKQAFLYTLTNSKGMVVKVSDFGAVLAEIHVPDRKGELKDVVLGYDNLKQYEVNRPSFGGLVGRHANRIAGASFVLNGVTYNLEKNSGENNLHSGSLGYQRRLWKGEEKGDSQVEFSLFSPDLDQGFPGNLEVNVMYTLTEENALRLSYYAVSDADTVLNLTNHVYFNLAGHDSGDVLSQKVWIDSDYYTETDEKSIPTGVILPVEGTVMDFREKKLIGEGIDSGERAVVLGNGYDHNWVLKTEEGNVSLVAGMEDTESGRGMKVYTDSPGLQFYTGNFLNGTEIGKGGVCYQRRSGACFETQYFPDSVHHKNFRQAVLKAGEIYRGETVFAFYVVES